MSKRKFTPAERYAIYTVHGEKCWLCGDPVQLTEMHVDHLIPEYLIGSPDLPGILKTFGLPETFDLNSWANWVPADAKHNQKKKAHIFEPSLLIQLQLEQTLKKAEELQKVHDNFLLNRNLSIAISRLMEAKKAGALTEAHQRQLAALAASDFEAHRVPEMKGKPFLIAPGLTVVGQDARQLLLQGTSGMVGYRPKGDHLHPSWDCPKCGPTGWSGTRCITCEDPVDPD